MMTASVRGAVSTFAKSQNAMSSLNIQLKDNLLLLISICLFAGCGPEENGLNRYLSAISKVQEKHPDNRQIIFMPVKGCACLDKVKHNPPAHFFDTSRFRLILFGMEEPDTLLFDRRLLEEVAYVDRSYAAHKMLGVSKIFISYVSPSGRVKEFNARNLDSLYQVK